MSEINDNITPEEQAKAEGAIAGLKFFTDLGIDVNEPGSLTEAESYWKAYIALVRKEHPSLRYLDFPSFEDVFTHIFIDQRDDHYLKATLKDHPQEARMLGVDGKSSLGDSKIANTTGLTPGQIIGGLGGLAFDFATRSETGQAVVKDVGDRAKRAAQGLVDRISGRSGRGNDGITYENDDTNNPIYEPGYTGGSLINPRGLSLNTDPITSDCRTPVKVTNYPKFYEDGRDNNGPVILKTGLVQLTPQDFNTSASATGTLYKDATIMDFVTSAMMKDILVNIQMKNVYNNKTEETVTYQKYVEWFNSRMLALSVYFWLQSTLAFQALPTNRNKGMEEIYNQLDPQDMLNLQNLGFELTKSVIPPRMVTFCHYIYDTYLQSDMPGAPVIKLIPWPFASTTTANTSFKTFAKFHNMGPVQYSREMLRHQNIARWNGLLAKSYPTWTTPTIGGYTGVPKVDPNYTTFWINTPYYLTSAGTTAGTYHVDLSTLVGTDNEEIQYNCHTDSPDGWTQGLICYKTNGGTIGPGLLKPVFFQTDSTVTAPTCNEVISLVSSYTISAGVNGQTSCYMFSENGNTGTVAPGYWPIESNTRFQTLSGNTYTGLLTEDGFTKFQRFGTTPMENTSKTGLRYTCEQLISWLILDDFNSATPRKFDSSAPPSGNQSRRGRRRSRGKATMSEDASNSDATGILKSEL